MASEMTYVLHDPGDYRSDWKKTVKYGRCEQSPHKDNGLWCVSLTRAYWEKGWDGTADRWDKSYPFEDHSFLVSEDHARPCVFEDFKWDVEKWSAVAHQVFVGSFCMRYECLWKDVPVYVRKLPNGSQVKYGYCRAQSDRHPERELWFVAFNSASPASHAGTFIVDKQCTEPDFLDRLQNDHWKWQSICWCRMDEGNEIRWDELKKGSEEGGLVRSHSSIGFDSPFLPFDRYEIEQRITDFEQHLTEQLANYQRLHSGFFEKKKRFENLSTDQRAMLEIHWRMQFSHKLLRRE